MYINIISEDDQTILNQCHAPSVQLKFFNKHSYINLEASRLQTLFPASSSGEEPCQRTVQEAARAACRQTPSDEHRHSAFYKLLPRVSKRFETSKIDFFFP